MRTGNELIRATRIFAKDDPQRSWWYLLSTGALLVIALLGSVWNFHISVQIVSSVFAGLLILRMFVIYHDHQHRAILAKSQIAGAIMWLFGIYSLSASSIWRSSHNYHHSHNSKLRGSHIGSFPIMTKAQFLKSSFGKRFKYLFMRHPMTILFGYVFVFIFGMALYPFVNQPRKHWDCLLALLVHVAIGIALFWFMGWKGWLLGQTVPHFIAYAVGSYLFYAQHNFPEAKFADSQGWTYEGAALESSSFLRADPVTSWFTANIGYHHIHHLNHNIPFYRLPDALKEIPELQHARQTSLHPMEIYRCLRLKVWDVDEQKMVGLS